jgi:excinuclease ABC subunit C
MAAAMQEASARQDYETAAACRDRLQALSSVQARQSINLEDLADMDVIALARAGGRSCVQVFFFRAGRNYGNRSYFPRHDKDETPEAVMSAFIAQFYENKPVLKNIMINITPEDKTLLEEALASKAGGRVRIFIPRRGNRRRVIEFAESNACTALERHMAEKAGEAKLLGGVAELFGMEEPPSRIEVYDNSHISGSNMVGAMIVAGPDGLNKSAYRKFNIKTAARADDYAMMREVMTRRFKRALKETPDMEGPDWPGLLLVDGGEGQLGACAEVLEECGVLDALTLVAVSKGPDRNAGRERFHMLGKPSFQLPVNDPLLHYLQRLRDEAHRFAIGTHRAKRQKQMVVSSLDTVPGIGAKRKKALLHYFGSAKKVAEAGVEDLQKVEGISRSIARSIYDHFH